ncbi:MAG: hypothetical protein HYU66_08495 [Armatimonadetes bacterium]|nr:hypothetical protein [Armatimonadota bacterium]
MPWLLLAILAATPGDRSGLYPGWLPAGECSPFYPDDAYLIRANADAGAKDCSFRTRFELPAQPVRAVLAVSATHTAAAHVNGALRLEVVDAEVERLPGFADVTTALRAGTNDLDLRVHSVWTVAVYAQLRVELPGGAFVDVLTDGSWEWHAGGGPGWPRGAAPDDGWQPVTVIDDYLGSAGRAVHWDKRFALMPRDLLRQETEPKIAAFHASWTADQRNQAVFGAKYVRPEYAAQYGGFLRIDPASGQVVDATGTIRHPFFTIYGQVLDGQTHLGYLEWDYDRLEDDLALMEQGGVHPYLRFTGWQSLLDVDGGWQRCDKQPKGTGLPHFDYNYQVLDYFLDRCQAHGRFAVLEGDFFWNASWDAAPGPYHTRWYLYPEMTELNALAHRKMLIRYAARPVVAGYMIGEEDVIMADDLTNGHLRTAFDQDLQRRYGSLERLKAAWSTGYDFADVSRCRQVSRKAEHWGAAAEDVLDPAYPLQPSVFGALSDWSQVPLPVWPRYRQAEAPHLDLPSHMSLNTFTPDDPSWIDYNAFREDRLYLDFVNHWAKVVRPAAPRQWLFHSNAQDFTSQWHFLHFYRRADLDFDVIGVGCHDSEQNLSAIAPFDRMRKYYKNISPYRAYVTAPGSPAVGVSCGEGEGGKAGNEPEILNYYRAQSFELLGHGGAFEQSYTWMHLGGADVDKQGKAHLTRALAWLGGFYRRVQGVKFALPRRVEVLIVTNQNLARSNRSGRDYGNAEAVAEALGQLNVEFDTVRDEDLAYGRQNRKIDLAPYRLVFLPCADLDYAATAWTALDRWLTDPAGKGKRALVIGYLGKRTPYLSPTPKFHPTAAKWLGQDDYASGERFTGKHTWRWSPPTGEARNVTLNDGDRGDNSATGFFAKGRPLLTLPDGRAGAVAAGYAGNTIYAFGFPLGKGWDLSWGIPIAQEPYDVMAGMWEDIATAAGIDRPVRAPHNLRVAVSDDRSVVLVQERFGIETTDLVSLKVPKGTKYEGCEMVPQAGGWTLLRRKLGAWEGVCLGTERR